MALPRVHVPWGTIAAAALAAAAAHAAWRGAWEAVLPLGAGAVAVLALILEPRMPRAVAGALSEGAQVGDVATLFELRGPPVLVPEAGTVRLFLAPDGAVGKRPMPHSTAPTVHREARAAVGVTVSSPADGLLRLWDTWSGLPTGAGAEEGILHVRRALHKLDLARAVRVLAAGDRLVLHMRPTFPLGSGTSRTGVLPTFLASLVALATTRPVAVVDVLATESRLEVHLEVFARTA